MKAWIFSDTHLPDVNVPITKVFSRIPEANLCICAGDIVEYDPVASVGWLAQHIRPHMRVIFVIGNHEFYNLGSSMERDRQRTKIAADWSNIDLLDDSAVNIEGVHFVGTTLWSDFTVFAGDSLAKRGQAMEASGNALNDFRLIRANENSAEIWTPQMARMQHLQSRFWLERVLEQHTGRRVIVSHHAPHPLSIAPQFAKDLVTAGYVSDLEDLILRHRPDLWIHGHTHSVFDYQVGTTRVRCNPRGYHHEKVLGFDAGLVIDI